MTEQNKRAPGVNPLIIGKLSACPPAVQELAARAVELAENLPEASVVEALESVVRDLVREEVDHS